MDEPGMTEGEASSARYSKRSFTISRSNVGLVLWVVWLVFVAGAMVSRWKGPFWRWDTLARIVIFCITVPWLIGIAARLVSFIVRAVRRSRFRQEKSESSESQLEDLRAGLARTQRDLLVVGASAIAVWITQASMHADVLRTRYLFVEHLITVGDARKKIEIQGSALDPSISLWDGEKERNTWISAGRVTVHGSLGFKGSGQRALAELYVTDEKEAFGVARVEGHGFVNVLLPEAR